MTPAHLCSLSVKQVIIAYGSGRDEPRFRPGSRCTPGCLLVFGMRYLAASVGMIISSPVKGVRT